MRMAGAVPNGSVGPSLPPPRPKSPPEYPDLYGKRRKLAKVQLMEREIGFLEEELKSFEGLAPASRSCKEVADFVIGNIDPLISTNKKIRRSKCFWKWICGMSCFNMSSICCCFNCCCSSQNKKRTCCDCAKCSCSNPCVNCRMPKCHCASCWNCRCSSKCTCNWNCCIPKCPTTTCLTCPSLKGCICKPKCPKVNRCSCCCCNTNCCYPCFFCCY